MAAAIPVAAGVEVTNITLPFVGAVSFGDAGGPLTVAGLVAVMNVVNLSDGADGLAAGGRLVAGGHRPEHPERGWYYSPTVVDGIVYIGSQTSSRSNDGRLNAFAAAGCGQPTCAPLWQGVAGSQSILESSPAVAGGVVYVGAFDGRLYAFGADGCGTALCQPLWVGRTGGSIESTPLVAKGFVYVGSDDGKFYAFKAKGCGKTVCSAKWTGELGSARTIVSYGGAVRWQPSAAPRNRCGRSPCGRECSTGKCCCWR